MTHDRSVVFLGPSVSSGNKTDCHDITKAFKKVELSIIKEANLQLPYNVPSSQQEAIGTFINIYSIFL